MENCIMCKLNGNILPYVGILKKYTFWTTMVSREQHTLGTLILALNRHSVRFSSLSVEELEELNSIQNELEASLDKHFSPDRYNYLQCGNQVEHLHLHLIPRYKDEKSFQGKVFVDSNWGDSVKETTEIESDELIEGLRDTIL